MHVSQVWCDGESFFIVHFVSLYTGSMLGLGNTNHGLSSFLIWNWVILGHMFQSNFYSRCRRLKQTKFILVLFHTCVSAYVEQLGKKRVSHKIWETHDLNFQLKDEHIVIKPEFAIAFFFVLADRKPLPTINSNNCYETQIKMGKPPCRCQLTTWSVNCLSLRTWRRISQRGCLVGEKVWVRLLWHFSFYLTICVQSWTNYAQKICLVIYN
jgi:hypothetical protein